MHRRPLLAFALLAATVLFACPKPSPSGGSSANPSGSDGGSQLPDGVVEPGPGDDGGTPSLPQSCLRDADCGGGVCEGQGCGDTEPGTCAPTDRICTRDSQAYCGCDGQTFRASGSCPGQRYAAKGECTGATPTSGPGADGTPCRAASDCQSGVCEGEGCGDDQPGECKPAARSCTRDYRAYCGCDGNVFRGSGSCPGQRYAHRGDCSTKP